MYNKCTLSEFLVNISLQVKVFNICQSSYWLMLYINVDFIIFALNKNKLAL